MSSSVLSALLGEAESQRFLHECWPAETFTSRVSMDSWPAFLVHDAWREPAKLDAIYRGPIDVTRGHIGQYRVTGAAPSGWVEDLGLAARLCDLENVFPDAGPWMRALEEEVGASPGSCKLGAFVNAAGVGLNTHCDPAEHLLIHVAGEKLIRVAPNPAGAFISASHSATFCPKSRECVQYTDGLPDWEDLPADAQEIRLVPGSVLFMPRGTYHQTVGGEGGVSASVVVKFNLPSPAELVAKYLEQYLLQDQRWRRPVVGAWGAAVERRRVVDQMKELLADLGGRAAGLSASAMLDALGDAAPLRPNTRVMRNPSVRVETFEGVVTLTPSRGRGVPKRLNLGTAAADAIVQLSLVRRPTTCAEIVARFAEWEESSIYDLLAFLVRAEVLVPLRVEPFA